MKVRYEGKNGVYYGTASRFNTHSLDEVLVYFDNGEVDSISLRELAVEIAPNTWKSMQLAFKDHDIITDNYDTMFFIPQNQEDRERGFTLY